MPTPPETTPATRRSPAGIGWAGRVDLLLLALVLGFAFLAASFTARNSDLWLHLATGRLLAHGDYTFGVDPFAYTTRNIYWANHAWLFDLGLYTANSFVGGAGLVILKGLGIATLAAVMLRTSRATTHVWMAAACTLLAVLAMSPRLILQPACLSILLLAVCVELLRIGGRAYRAVPVLIALWVNLDGWFVLGPIVVALFWVGRRLESDVPVNSPLPVWLLPACLLACLLSPHHIHGFTLPPELSPAVWRSEMPDDPRLAGLFASPWRLASFGPAGGSSLAAWAFVTLLVVGVGSFLVNLRSLRTWRGPVWLVFAALAAWQVRLIPFFAAVAGPITSMNFGEMLGSRFPNRTGRGLTGLAAGTLLVLGWLGCLQGFSSRDRAAAWAVYTDPSLEKMARELARWRAEGILPATRHVAELHPDVAHYMVWFCPGEKVFLDSRLTLFTSVAADYLRVAQGFGIVPEESRPDGRSWDSVFRDNEIVVAVLFDPDGRRYADGLWHVKTRADQWKILRVEGAAVIVAPNGEGYYRPSVEPFNPDREAFGRTGNPAALAEGPQSLPEPAEWWNGFTRRPRVDSAEAGAAGVYLRLFPVAPSRQDQPTKIAGVGRSPALPLLAIRAGRAAVVNDPADSAAWFALGRAYLDLGRGTWEADTQPGLSLLGPLRHVQTVAAFHQVTLLDPSYFPAHDLLANVFAERQYHDLSLRHRETHLRLVRRAGRLPGETPAEFAARLAPLEAAVEQLERVVQDGENRFLVHTYASAGDPLARARVALQYGLVAKAQDVLLKSHPDLYGAEGVALLLRILVQTGQVDEARVLLEREELVRNPSALGQYQLPGGTWEGRVWEYRLSAYNWYELCQAASSGRYNRAATALERLGSRLEREQAALVPQVRSILARQIGSEVGLSAPPGSPLARMHVGRERGRLIGYAADAVFLGIQRADLHTIGGLLLAEQGNPTAALTEFERAMELYTRAESVAKSPPGRDVAIKYRDAIRRDSR